MNIFFRFAVSSFIFFCFIMLSSVSAYCQHSFFSQAFLEHIGYISHSCAITFDDGPGPYTSQLLDILKERHIKATFFLSGENIREYPEIVKRMIREGHDIGNHTLQHKQLRKLSPDEQWYQIITVQYMLNNLGARCQLFRPPYGIYNSATIAEARRQGLSVVLWTVDAQDWMHRPSVSRLVSLNGHDCPTTGIFLFHDTHQSTVQAIAPILDYLEQSGSTFVTVSEYLNMGMPVIQALFEKYYKRGKSSIE